MSCVPINRFLPRARRHHGHSIILYGVDSKVPCLSGGQCLSLACFTRFCLYLACCRSELDTAPTATLHIAPWIRYRGQKATLYSLVCKCFSTDMNTLIDNIGSEHRRRRLDFDRDSFQRFRRHTQRTSHSISAASHHYQG